MNPSVFTSKNIVKLIALYLAITFVLIVFLPHTHSAPQNDCCVCAVSERLCDPLLINMLLSSLFLSYILFGIIYPLPRVTLNGESTPVELKDKLSN